LKANPSPILTRAGEEADLSFWAYQLSSYQKIQMHTKNETKSIKSYFRLNFAANKKDQNIAINLTKKQIEDSPELIMAIDRLLTL
jgi:hypothetical protein